MTCGWGAWVGAHSCSTLLLHRQGEQGPKGEQGDRGPPGEPVSAPRPPHPMRLVTGDPPSEGGAAARTSCIARPQAPPGPNAAPSSLVPIQTYPQPRIPTYTQGACPPPPRRLGRGRRPRSPLACLVAGVTGPSWRPGASRSPGAAGKKTLPGPVGPRPGMPAGPSAPRGRCPGAARGQPSTQGRRGPPRAPRGAARGPASGPLDGSLGELGAATTQPWSKRPRRVLAFPILLFFSDSAS